MFIQELSVNIDEHPYLKLGLFCPFWMVNKTSLTLYYKASSLL